MKPTRTAILVGVFAAAIFASHANAATLGAPAKAALLDALDDEYRAEAFYAAVIAKFGSVRPFSNIIEAERTHSAELRAILKFYDVDAPINNFINDPKITTSVPATIAEACAIGVKAEIDNRDLYDKRLMPAVSGYADIVAAFRNLRDASDNNHLPAFRNCSDGVGRGERNNRGAGRP